MTDFLHTRKDFKNLIEITARNERIDDPSLVEKDYWIMHCLYGIQQADLSFELKGGTSLSKGFGIIHRFSEDIDIRIEPDEALTGFKVYSGKNHDDKKHRDSRKQYFDWLAQFLGKKIPDIAEAKRDTDFDDSEKYRNGGIRLSYKTELPLPGGLKEGILLEVGFDTTTPNLPRTISSWVTKTAQNSKVDFTNNEAKDVPCYELRYTFVEKLQAVVRKFRQHQEKADSKSFPSNFLRHYYDIYQLIDQKSVQEFVGTKEYTDHKKLRFGSDDTKVSSSEAFRLNKKELRELFENEYLKTKALYYRGQPTFQEILDRIGKDLDRL